MERALGWTQSSAASTLNTAPVMQRRAYQIPGHAWLTAAERPAKKALDVVPCWSSTPA